MTGLLYKYYLCKAIWLGIKRSRRVVVLTLAQHDAMLKQFYIEPLRVGMMGPSLLTFGEDRESV